MASQSCDAQRAARVASSETFFIFVKEPGSVFCSGEISAVVVLVHRQLHVALGSRGIHLHLDFAVEPGIPNGAGEVSRNFAIELQSRATSLSRKKANKQTEPAGVYPSAQALVIRLPFFAVPLPAKLEIRLSELRELQTKEKSGTNANAAL